MRTDLSGRGIVNILAAERLLNRDCIQVFSYGFFLSYSRISPKSAIWKNPSSCSFSMKHICFSTTHRRRCANAWSRSSGSFDRKGSEFFLFAVSGRCARRNTRSAWESDSACARAFTPRDQKAVRTAAETFVANPKLDVSTVISELAVGEALVSTLQENGVPMAVERALIAPPRCRMGAVTPEERAQVRARSTIGGKYDNRVNRESAYEILSRRRCRRRKARKGGTAAPEASKQAAEPCVLSDLLWGSKRRQGLVEAMAKQAARSPSGAKWAAGCFGMYGNDLWRNAAALNRRWNCRGEQFFAPVEVCHNAGYDGADRTRLSQWVRYSIEPLISSITSTLRMTRQVAASNHIVNRVFCRRASTRHAPPGTLCRSHR